MVSWLRVPKIIINDTINLFFTAVGILVTSNHNSFRVVFDKLLPNIFYVKNILLEMASRGNQHCASCIGTLLFRIIM